VDVSVTVSRDGAPAAGAVVCLRNDDAGIYKVATADAAGLASLSIEASSAGQADLTVTARNSIPRGEVVPLDGETGVEDGIVSGVTALAQNFPNPFNPRTNVAFALSARMNVSVIVYDVSGREVVVLVDDEMDAGDHSVVWDGRDARGNDVASGTYFARMVAGSRHFETKMILMR
jgi:hypothetical protein